MSQRMERLKSVDRDTLYSRTLDLYHIPVIALLMVFMLWVRVRTWKNFVTSDQIYFSGNDAWYHLRQTTYTVTHWPSTMPFDPWTHFPYGTASGQFGTFYDQIVATAALIIGLGSPDQRTIALTLLFAPAVIGTLIAIPVYYIGRRLSGRAGGLTAVLLLSLTSGGFLFRSLVGFSDHHVAEILFSTIAFLAVMVTLRVAHEEKPVFELVQEREWNALRRPLIYGTLAGGAIAIYIWTWPPGILFAALLSVFFIVQLIIEYLRGESPDHTAVVGIITLVVGGVGVAIQISTLSVTATKISLLQPGLLFLVAVGLGVMAAIARVFDARDIDRRLYPVVVLGGILLSVTVVAVLLPNIYSYIVDQALRVIGLSTTAQQRTVAEAKPLSLDPNSQTYWLTTMTQNYGIAFFSAIAAFVMVVGRIVQSEESRPELLLVVVWFGFMVLATFTQTRFNYYLAIPIVLLNGYLVGVIAHHLSLDAVDRITRLEKYQVLSIIVVLLILTGPFAVLGTQSLGSPGLSTIAQSERNQPGSVTNWDSSLAWLSNNTPAEGQYGHPDQSPLSYYGTYENTDDFDYGKGGYGVISWWDYGHWITVLGERIPVANPFQQGATKAANFLLAPNESQARKILEKDSEGTASTRYVMLDKSFGSYNTTRYPVPIQFETNYSLSAADLRSVLYQEGQRGQFQPVRYIPNKRHFESLRARLYEYHGSAIDPEPVVFDWEPQQVRSQSGEPMIIKTVPADGNYTKKFDNMNAAREYVKNDNNSRIGVNTPQERVPALQHYRLVYAGEELDLRTGNSYVKTFERVDGATIEGTGPANATVKATVELRIPTSNKTFNYTQYAQTDENGTFTMTLPYSTTGYDNWGPEEGHTNVSVRATGQYTFTATKGGNSWNASTDVSEGKVNGADDGNVTVELTEQGAEQSGEKAGNGGSGDQQEQKTRTTETNHEYAPKATD